MGDLSQNFSRAEFACKDGCGRDTVDAGTLAVLEAVRTHFGLPVTVVSGHRCATHTRAVGGASSSQHLYGRAADIKIAGVAPQAIADFLDRAPLAGRGGIGVYPTFVHVDTRSGGAARWRG